MRPAPLEMCRCEMRYWGCSRGVVNGPAQAWCKIGAMSDLVHSPRSIAAGAEIGEPLEQVG